MAREHRYTTTTTWTGQGHEGTATYRSYERAHETEATGRPVLLGSSDRVFRGDPARWNPELLLVAALSQCHMLAYLHQCAVHGVVATSYVDHAEGVMVETDEGGGRFTSVVLRPLVSVTVADMVEVAQHLHERAAELCFIAASVNFPVGHEPRTVVAGSAPDEGSG